MKFLCQYATVAVAECSCDDSGMRYVLPVLWIAGRLVLPLAAANAPVRSGRRAGVTDCLPIQPTADECICHWKGWRDKVWHPWLPGLLLIRSVFLYAASAYHFMMWIPISLCI